MKLLRVVSVAALVLALATSAADAKKHKATQCLADPDEHDAPATATLTPTTKPAKSKKATTASKASSLLRVKLYKRKNLLGKKLSVKAEPDVCYSVETCFDDLASSISWSKVPANVQSIELFDSGECDGESITFTELGGVGGSGSVKSLRDYEFSKKVSSFVVRSVDGDDEILDEESACSEEDDAEALEEAEDDDSSTSAKSKTPKPAKTKTPKTPKPAKTKTPKPAKTKTPKPVKTKTPKPAKSKTPKPAKTKTPKSKTTTTPSLRVKLYKRKNLLGKKLSVKAHADTCYSVESCFDDLTTSLAWSKIPSNAKSIVLFDSADCEGASVSLPNLGAVGGNGSVTDLEQYGFSKKLSSFVVRSIDGDDEIEEDESACTAEDDADAIADADEAKTKTKKPTTSKPAAKVGSLRVRLYKKDNLLGKHLYVKAQKDVCYSVESCFDNLASSLSWSRVPHNTKSLEVFDSSNCGGVSVSFTNLGAYNASGNVTSLAAYDFSKMISSFVVRSTSGDDEITDELSGCAADSSSGSSDSVADVADDDESEGDSTTAPVKASSLRVRLYKKTNLTGKHIYIKAETDVCYSVDSCFNNLTSSLSWTKTPRRAKSIELYDSVECGGASVSISDLGAVGGNGSVASLKDLDFSKKLSSFIVRSTTGDGEITAQESGCAASNDTSSSSSGSGSAGFFPDVGDDDEVDAEASLTTAPSVKPTSLRVKLFKKEDLTGGKLTVVAAGDVCYNIDSCFGDKTTSLSWAKIPSDVNSIQLFKSAGCVGANVSLADALVSGHNGSVSTLKTYNFDNKLSSFIVRTTTGNGSVAGEVDACDDGSSSSGSGSGSSVGDEISFPDAADDSKNETTTAPSPSDTTAPTNTSSIMKVKLYNRVDLNGTKLVVNTTVDVCYTVDGCFGDKTTSLEWLKTPSIAESIELFDSAGCAGTSVLISDLGAAGDYGSVPSLIKAKYKFNNMLSSFVVHSKEGKVVAQANGCSASGSDSDNDTNAADDDVTVAPYAVNATSTPSTAPTTSSPATNSSSNATTVAPVNTTTAPRTSVPTTPAPTTKKPTKVFKVKLYTSADLLGSHHFTEVDNDVCYSVDTCFNDKTTSIAWVNTPKDAKSIDLFDGAGCTDSFVSITSLGVAGGSGNVSTIGKTTYKFNNKLSSFIVRSTTGKNVIQSQVDDCAVKDASGSGDADILLPVIVTLGPTPVVNVTKVNSTEAPVSTTAAPVGAGNVTEPPSSPASTTQAPATLAPTTNSSVTSEPSTAAPVTTAATTESPVTPATVTTGTLSPTSGANTTAQATASPPTPAPASAATVTPVPTTLSPDTGTPLTSAPNSTAPVTATPKPTTVTPVTPAPTPVPTTKKPTKVFKVKLYTSADLLGSHHFTEVDNDVCYSVDTCFNDKTTSIAWVNTPKDAKSIDLFDGAGCTDSFVSITSLGVAGGSGNVSTIGKTTYKFNNKLSSFIVRSTTGKNVIQSQVDDCAVKDASGSSDAGDVLASVAPVPVTPGVTTTLAPVTSIPVTTPSPSTPSPSTPAPAATTPLTTAAKTDVPVTPVPATTSPATLVPITETPETPAPVTTTPATEAPSSPTPTAVASVTPVPTSLAPMTTTEAPVTPTSTATPAPTTDKPSTSEPSNETVSTPAPTTVAPVTAVPAAEASTTSVPTTITPATSVTTTEAPVNQTPATVLPTTEAPVTPAPTPVASVTTAPEVTEPTSAPVTQLPTTEVPVTSLPATDAPASVHAGTEAPVNPALTTTAPATSRPTTEAPATEAPTTPAPTTVAPATPAPTTEAPATPAPVTVAPVTPAPTTEAPATPAPTTEAPATPAPVTEAPVTVSPVTPAPVTVAPVTPAPTTQAPVTTAPTPVPTTLAPVTAAPVTPAPTTTAPVKVTPKPTTVTPVTPAPTPVPTTKKPTKVFKVKLYTSADLLGSHHFTEVDNDVCYSVDTCFNDKTTSIAWVNTPKDAKSIDLFDGAGCTDSFVSITSLGVAGGSGNVSTIGKTTYKFNNKLSSFIVRSTTGKNVIQSQVDDCAAEDSSGSA